MDELDSEAKRLTYSDAMPFNEVMEAFSKGREVLCPICGYPLIDATELQTANELKLHRGVYCSNIPPHVQISIEVALDPSFWERFHKRP
jgi:hypothetical protein